MDVGRMAVVSAMSVRSRSVRFRALWPPLLMAAMMLAVLGWAPPAASQGSADTGPVYVIEITGTIDLGLAPYVDRVLAEAAEADAAAVIVRIDTPGGRLDAVLQMRDSLIDSDIPTVAFVDSTAFSAGALVALASETIYMTPGAVMGAATPVSGGTGEVADAKTISAVRSVFESTAELRGRDPDVAAAMVDTDVAVAGLVGRDSLLTLTTTQATEVGYADGVVGSQAELLDELGLSDAEIVATSPGLAERLVRILTNPVLASILLSVGVLALIGDLASGGIGIGVAVGVALLGVFFWGHTLAGLTGWEDAALVVLGVALIAVEIFVLPGFGVAGVLGLASLLAGAFLARIYRDFDFVTNDDLVEAALSISLTFVAVVVGSALLLIAMSNSSGRSGLVLQAQVGVSPPITERAGSGWLRWFHRRFADPDDTALHETDSGSRRGIIPTVEGSLVADDPGHSLVGATGIALSDLRPSGIAEIDGRRIDVVTRGDYLARGEAIEVISDEGYRRIVRRRPA